MEVLFVIRGDGGGGVSTFMFSGCSISVLFLWPFFEIVPSIFMVLLRFLSRWGVQGRGGGRLVGSAKLLLMLLLLSYPHVRCLCGR